MRISLKTILCLTSLAGFMTTPIVSALDLHVFSDGNDGNPGTKLAPLKTLEAARDAARAFAGKEPVTVHVGDGTHYLPQTLVFRPEESGSEQCPVVFQAANEGRAILSGGQRLELTWKEFRNGIYQATTPAGLAMDQLFIDGKCQRMARYPNFNPTNSTAAYQGFAADAFSKERATRWADPTGGFIHAMHQFRWGGFEYRITGKKPDGAVTYEGGWQNNRPSLMHEQFRMVENIFEELDAPGEWFHDAKSHTLYFLPEAGIDPSKATVEIVRLRHLIEFQGTAESPVRSIRLQGFVFRHATRTFMETKEPLLRSDWTIYRGGAVMLTGTKDCEIANCTFDQLGGNAIFVNNYNRGTTIRGCVIADTGANGICFVGDPAAVRNALFNYGQRLKPADLDRTPGPKSDNFPADCLVDDCLIYRSGRVEKQTAPVGIDMAQSITVRHCSIYDVPRAGINIGDGCWGGHVIEFCDIFDTVMETGDHGSFNSWGRDRHWPGNIFNLDEDTSWATNRGLPFLDAMKPNILRNNRWRCDHGWDIDLDDGSSNYEIRNNLCLHGGIKNREGFGRIVENNVMTASGFHPHVWDRFSGDIFRRNIMASAGYLPARMGKPPWGAEMDFNLVHVPGQITPKPALKLAQQSGRDGNSIMADAQFVDPARGDFRVRDGSPALKLGFVNFPMDQFGVQKPSLKAIARTPSFADAKTTKPLAAAPAVIRWLGAQIKTLSTIEEASSVGVGLETGGVLVLEVPANSAAAKGGLRQGDLIVRIDRKSVKTTAELTAQANSADHKPVELGIVRDQGQQTIAIH